MVPAFLPLPPNRVWRTYAGGRTLDLLEGLPEPRDGHFPEDWIGSTTRAVNLGREELAEEGLSRVTLPGAGEVLLRDLLSREPELLLGRDHFARHGHATRFLLKFLDSAIRLHLQCHPTIAFARARLGSDSGKTEAYYILNTREEVAEPYIYLGFQRPPDREAYRRAILAQDVETLLAPFDRIPVRPGDVFIVPGGLPHAIGEGIFMMEIMEPTDFAVRIEFKRGDYVLPESARFMGRDVDFALDMMSFEALSREEIRRKCFLSPCRRACSPDGSRFETMVGPEATPCFRVGRLSVESSVSLELDSFAIAVVTRGRVELESRGGSMTAARFGKLFVPYGSKEFVVRNLEPEQSAEVTIVQPPAVAREDGRAS